MNAPPIRQDSQDSVFTILRKCIAMLPAAKRWKWAILPPVSLITGVIEAGAAAAVFALIKIIGDPSTVNRMPITRTIAAVLPHATEQSQLLAFTALLAAYYVVKNLLVMGGQFLRHKIVGESIAALKATMFDGYLAASYPFHLGRNSADLIWNANYCVETICGEAMSAAVAAGAEILTAAAITMVLLYTAPRVTLLAGTFLVAVLAALLRVTRRMAERYGRERTQLEKASLLTLQEALGGIKEVKALGREQFFADSFGEQQRQVQGLGYLGKTLENIAPLVTETVFVCGALAVIALVTGTGQVHAQGLPLLALFGYAAFRIVPAANRVSWRVSQVRSAGAGVASLYDDYLLLNAAALEPEGLGNGGAAKFHHNITLDHVSFVFPGTDAPALEDICLTIEAGESVGIVGPTGAGKTTLVDLVVGLLRPSSGRILIDGNELIGHLASWKRNVGYVGQSIFLTDDTLRRNIALGIGDSSIDENRVRSTLRMAQLEQFVAELPRGLDTTVGERGVRLSGGERQRVGIARALYHDPALLIFDEATSALDHVTEAALTQAIEALHGKKTLLVVAHRLSTVRHCDRLVLVSEGRIQASGPYHELLRDNQEFQRMVSAQARLNPLAG